jgi:hypothetical protein
MKLLYEGKDDQVKLMASDVHAHYLRFTFSQKQPMQVCASSCLGSTSLQSIVSQCVRSTTSNSQPATI